MNANEGTPGMNQKKKEYFIKKILQERDRILGGIDSLSENYEVTAGDRATEFEETASTEREKEYLWSLISQDIEEMSEVNEALKRIIDGTYGICVDCGEKIPEARLEAKPTAIRCVACQDKFEQRPTDTGEIGYRGGG